MARGGGVSNAKVGSRVEMALRKKAESHLDIECKDVKESFYGGKDYPRG